MPTYTFFNKQAGIEYDETMPMSEYDKYMENNPNIERVFQPVALGGDNMMGIGPKTDSGFNDILGRIADNNPVSPMADKFAYSPRIYFLNWDRTWLLRKTKKLIQIV